MDYLRTQRKIDSEWQDIKFEELKDGDIFRMYKSTGELVIDRDGDFEFMADNDAYVNENGIYEVKIRK